MANFGRQKNQCEHRQKQKKLNININNSHHHHNHFILDNKRCISEADERKESLFFSLLNSIENAFNIHTHHTGIVFRNFFTFKKR